jgi:hypothetical protein
MFAMYRHKYPFIVDNPSEIACIDIREAHILWNDGGDYHYRPGMRHPEGWVKVFRFMSSEAIRFLEKKNDSGIFADTGACWSSWKTVPIPDLVSECKEMMIEFVIRGMDPILVTREFGKIRQIVEEGGKSFWMGRCLSMAFQGLAIDSTEQWQLEE